VIKFRKVLVDVLGEFMAMEAALKKIGVEKLDRDDSAGFRIHTTIHRSGTASPQNFV
jgi:hypothetical protein